LQYECQFRRHGFFIEILPKFQEVVKRTVSAYGKKCHDMKKNTSNFKIGIPLSGKKLHTGEARVLPEERKADAEGGFGGLRGGALMNFRVGLQKATDEKAEKAWAWQKSVSL
jgi:hypothetical protein